jgi:hypothetical protein
LSGAARLTAVPSGKRYPVGAYVETMATNAAGCAGVTVGADFYQTSVGATKAACAAASARAWVLVLDAQSLSEQALKELPAGSGASAGLTAALAPYVGDYKQHLVVLVAPAGCCSGDASISNSGFSAIWNLNAGVADLANIPAKGSGAKNDGNKLTAGAASPAGDLAGYLQPVNAGPQVVTYAFTQSGYLSFDTKTAQTTLVGTTPSAPQLNDVDVLVTGQGTALAVKDGSTDGGQALAGNDESDLSSQRWRLAPSGVAGYYHLITPRANSVPTSPARCSPAGSSNMRAIPTEPMRPISCGTRSGRATGPMPWSRIWTASPCSRSMTTAPWGCPPTLVCLDNGGGFGR